MIRFNDLAIFVRVATVDSFSAVAREMDLFPAQISAAIKRLECELDTRLFARSTRSLRLTAEGERYLPYAREVLNTLSEGRAGLQQDDRQLHGVLQIASASDFGRNVLLPWLISFRRENPGLVLRVMLSDSVSDIFRDPVDVAVRYGTMQNADFISLPLVPGNRRVIAASPAYIALHGRPESVGDLKEHACLRFHMNGKLYDRWIFPNLPENDSVIVNGPVLSDDADVIRRCAIAGEGILYKSWLDVCEDVSAGHLEVLLPDIPGELYPLSFVCPHRKQFTPALRLLYAYLKDKCEALLLTHAQAQVSDHCVATWPDGRPG
ncbi:DNA-binding transcriptional regulator, LysR family [Pseudomonas sp. Z003-0.4C(8344-21)]|uniref:LysR family transcriptional regulator n=1 Tax=Pseudomonas sp. Z003-0.4C(8344-21) TaxID=1855380 RepID=UPI00087974FA|nr:LysR family transcriptional regulator [Pseudomonas sp. Z003-0.4C(8344-21)]SDT02756.1 DNA-binding transcriptional regulator, LysR family [Pseudomonas sp. Z003-0.4C(8344-21)]